MKRIILIAVFAVVAPVSLMAQSISSFHVFPQIADGTYGDGSYFQTIVFATNVNALPATCTFRMVGVPESRLLAGSVTTGTLAAQGSISLAVTSGNVAPLATGYATLTCDRPVTAYAAYISSSAAGIVVSAATVFSSPPTTRAHLIVIQTGGNRGAFAIANDTDRATQYKVDLINSDATQTVATTTISVPARSNLARFLDEIMPVPPNFIGSFVITSPSSPFNVVGLVFNGSVFGSEPATIY